jgi:outer membrane protein insertion porin family
VIFSLDRGPLVTISFSGDTVPEDEREALVPIQAEASVDEDLLEDSSRAIENYFKGRGYRDALVDYTRNERDGGLVINFAVTRGARYLTDEVTVTGNTAVATTEIVQAIRLEADAPFVEANVDAGLGAVRNLYRARGFTRADIRAVSATLPNDNAGVDDDRRLALSVTVNEGPRTRVGTVALTGNTVFTEAELRAMIVTAPGRPFNELEIAADRDRIDLEYRNRGYDSIVVQPTVALADSDTRANVSLAISEGPQIFVDQVIILGNQRTSLDTISRELTLRPGEPLGYAAMLESQQRLSALGLFRRIQITALVHPGEPRRDILVQLEEAPPTTLGYGGGLEGTVRVRSDEQGLAEERFELAPRGFFEVTRRNLFGKNRSVSLFGRVSLKSRNVVFAEDGVRLREPDGSYGFNEYRVYSTYREPRIFNSRADFLVTGILDQAIRSSFNFRTREARAELGLRVSPIYSFAGRYSFEHTTLFDEQYDESEKPLIDKLFPQVRLSKVAASLVRDSRDDVIYPNRGMFTVIDGEIAGRAMGSEVGFVKTFVQTFAYVSLPTRRRTILALAARVGAARGFELRACSCPRASASSPAATPPCAASRSIVLATSAPSPSPASRPAAMPKRCFRRSCA